MVECMVCVMWKIDLLLFWFFCLPSALSLLQFIVHIIVPLHGAPGLSSCCENLLSLEPYWFMTTDYHKNSNQDLSAQFGFVFEKHKAK